jgi:hypothetical protein
VIGRDRDRDREFSISKYQYQAQPASYFLFRLLQKQQKQHIAIEYWILWCTEIKTKSKNRNKVSKSKKQKRQIILNIKIQKKNISHSTKVWNLDFQKVQGKVPCFHTKSKQNAQKKRNIVP